MKSLKRILAGLTASASIALTATTSFANQTLCGANESWAQVKQRVESANPQVETHEVFDVAKNILVKSYNEAATPMVIHPDKVRFILLPDNPVALVVFSKESCVLDSAYIPVSVLAGVLFMGTTEMEM